MFEEVPRRRTGLSGLVSRRIALGPFVIGGGVLLATVGGSVAVAATVITASSIHTADLPQKPRAELPVAPSTASHSHSASATPSKARVSPSATVLPRQPSTRVGSAPGTSIATSPPVVAPPTPSASAPTSVMAKTSATATGTPSASPTPTPTSTGPVGNALIYLVGYDQATARAQFEYAQVQPGAGPNGSNRYVVSGPQKYTATLSPTVQITSAGTVCPPAGSSCTVAEFAVAAQTGFFAQAAIGDGGQLQLVIEVDNVSFGAGPPLPSSSAGSSVAPSASPASSSATTAAPAASAG